MINLRSKSLALTVLTLTALFWSSSVLAVLPDEMLSNRVEEARALALSKNLRCVVCQNQNIDDSAAPIARDMRLLLRERIAAGDTDDQAVAYLVARYGNYVLLKPPFQADTWLLWIAPFGVLAVGALGLLVSLRRRASRAPVEPLNAAEQERLALLLSGAASLPPPHAPTENGTR
jgi:cytochrome c-type biogenesis protein CcmH